MGEKICGIIGDDETYLRRLMGAMNSYENFAFRIQIYTDIEALYKYLENHSMDILVADKRMEIAKKGMQAIGRVIWLTDEPGDDENGIYKYQAVGQVINRIIALSGNLCAGGSVRFIGVYSPVCGCGKTCLSLALAKFYGKNKKTLYMNFEQFSGLIRELPPNSQDLSDVAYMYRSGEQALLQCLDSAIIRGEFFDYIAPVECVSDIEFITTSQWLDMVSFIGNSQGYDIVVIDGGNAIKEPWQLVQLCSLIYMPQRQDLMAKNKVRAFEKYLIAIGKEALLERVVAVELEPEEIGGNGSMIAALEGTRLWQKVGQIANGR